MALPVFTGAAALAAEPAALPPVPPPGLRIFDFATLIRPGATDSVAAMLTRGLLPPVSAPRSYDLWDMRAMAKALKPAFAGLGETPRPTRRGRPDTATGDAGDYAGLRTAFATCTTTGDVDRCRLDLGATDYENLLGDPVVMPVSAARGLLNKRLNADQRATIAAVLTGLMARLQARLAADLGAGAPGGAVPLAVRPVAVTVGPPGEVNISSAYGADTLVIGEDVVRDIYLRAFHRAVHGQRQRAIDNNMLDDCDGCDAATRARGVIVTDFARLRQVADHMPGLRIRGISSRWFAAAVRKGCSADVVAAAAEGLVELDGLGDKDLRENVGEDWLQRLGPCADDGTHRLTSAELRDYVEEFRAMEHGDTGDDGDDLTEGMADSYFPLAIEMQTLNAAWSAELAKAFLFLLAHESYHVWMSRAIGPAAEFAADAHAARMYLALYPEIDPEQWFRSMTPPSVTGASMADTAKVFSTILGREPSQVLNELYLGSRYYSGTWSHPPVPERVERVKAIVADGRRALTCAALPAASPGQFIDIDRAGCSVQ